EALESQKALTFSRGGQLFVTPRTERPWETDGQIRKTAWAPALKRASVRYRYPYQTRHTYASTMLSAGENPLWVAQQMGHRDWGNDPQDLWAVDADCGPYGWQQRCTRLVTAWARGEGKCLMGK